MTAAVLLAAAALMALAAWRLRILRAPATGRHALTDAHDEAAAEQWLVKVRATRSQPPAGLFPPRTAPVLAVPPPVYLPGVILAGRVAIARHVAMAAEARLSRPWADETGSFTRQALDALLEVAR